MTIDWKLSKCFSWAASAFSRSPSRWNSSLCVEEELAR